MSTRCPLVAIALATSLFAQTYVNGPFVTHPGGFGACAPPGDASALESTPPLSLSTFGYSVNAAFRLSDEFTVPDGLSWAISTFKVYGYQTGSPTNSTFTAANYRIWSGIPGSGGVLLHDFSGNNQMVNTNWTGAYRATALNLGICGAGTNRPIMEVVMSGNGIVLGPGTYSLDYSLAGSLASGPFAPPITILGAPISGNARQQTVGTGAWAPITSATLPPGPYQQGLPFEVAYSCLPVFFPLFPMAPLTAIPYIPGNSFGPISFPPDPLLDQDQRNYAIGYWQTIDSCGTNDALVGFLPASPNWHVPSTGLSADPDPFGEGRILFTDVFAHRLQLDPSVGPLFDLDDLIWSDSIVALQWRFWTQTHQLVTVDSLDPVAHANHITFLIDALTSSFQWGTQGVPYFDNTISTVVSENTKKKAPAPPPLPAPLPLGGLPANVQALDAVIRAGSGVISGFPGLYDADGDGKAGHVGFDCDDFADAIGYYLIKGQPGATATTMRVTWKDSNGQAAAHRVTKITLGGHYWIVDAQTGAVDGPYANATPADARNVLGGYDINNACPIVTTDDNRPLGDRPSPAEPPAWCTDPAQRARFQLITGLDPACFCPC